MLFQDWSVECLQTMTVKPSTRASYESLLRTRVLPTFGDTPLDAITTMAVQRWVVQTGQEVSASRARQAFHVLSGMLGMAVNYGELAKTPCTNIKLPRLAHQEKTFLTPLQVRALAEASGHYQPFVLFLAYTGLRWSEATGLRYSDIDGNRMTVAQACVEVNGHLIYGTPKSHHKRAVVLPSGLMPVLEPLLEAARSRSDGLVFTTKFGCPMRIGNFRTQVWKPALRRAQLPVNLGMHSLRHTCAAMLVKQNVPPKAIQRILGHASITTTLDIYGHLFESALDDAAASLNALWV